MNSAGPSHSLLVVHGIGTQARGDTLHQCVEGLIGVCQPIELRDFEGKALVLEDIRKRGLSEVRLHAAQKQWSLAEVYWADIADDALEGDFSSFAFEETSWFPLLNFRAGLLPAELYPRWLIYARTAQLLFLQVTMTLALEFVMGFRCIRESILNRTVEDVWFYARSLGGEHKADSKLKGASQEVLDRFETAWRKITTESGTPPDVVAHSLGSVIAYHALTRRLATGATRRLITIGSPLEKTRLLWAKLFPPVAWDWQWFNFHSPSDPVSGKLKRFDGVQRIENERLWGIGGFGQAHVGYFKNPRVMQRVAEGLGLPLTSSPKLKRTSWLGRRLIDVVVPSISVVLVLLGAALTAVFFYLVILLTGYFTGAIVGLFSSAWGGMVRDGWIWFWLRAMVVMWPLFLVKDGYARCVTRHERRWNKFEAPK